MNDSEEKQQLPPEQIEALRRVLQSRKARAKKDTTAAKPKVSKEEYVARLNASIREDSAIAANRYDARIAKNLEDWKDRVGKRFANAQIENERIAEIVGSRVQRIIEGKIIHRNSLILTGHLGVGKTWTGYAYIRQLIQAGVLQSSEVVADTEIGLLAPIALAHFDRADKIKALINPKYKFYFIDEVGRATFGKTPEVRHEIWYALINHAYENHIPVVMTTNKSTSRGGTKEIIPGATYANQLEEWIGDAAYDRLKYMVGDDGAIVPGATNKRGAVNDMLDHAEEAPKAQPEKQEEKNHSPF